MTTPDPSAQIVCIQRTNDAHHELFVLDDTGTNLRQLSNTPRTESFPT